MSGIAFQSEVVAVNWFFVVGIGAVVGAVAMGWFEPCDSFYEVCEFLHYRALNY